MEKDLTMWDNRSTNQDVKRMGNMSNMITSKLGWAVVTPKPNFCNCASNPDREGLVGK